MRFEIEISAQAEQDLRGIYEYIAHELQSVKNAKAQLNRLEERISGLDRMPDRFRAYEKEPWHSRGLRIMPVDHYCVFYIPDAKKAVVTVLRVMYGGRDMETQWKNMGLHQL
jgi:toxin ParE1/3/4